MKKAEIYYCDFGDYRSQKEKFNKIYVFNLRENQPTSGELNRKVDGNIFGSGSRAPIAITILVKKAKSQ